MRNLFSLRPAAAALALLLSAGGASAHQVWIEQEADGARLYFGEFGDNLREISPGLLDKFSQMDAALVDAKGGERSLSAQKTGAFFALGASAGKGESIVAAEVGYPAFERKDGDKTIRTVWVPAARYVSDFAERTPSLALDIAPAGKTAEGAVAFKVTFRGQPLPKAKVALVALSGWSQEHRTDENGAFTATLPWKGAYVAEVAHTDKTPGERKGETHDQSMYVTSLSFVTDEGMPSPPAPPAAKPN
ncbi:DUF4198 domain-containing protein [Oceanibaculum pacificum]|uniref:Cobalt ABC transporter substrate-binding protein n=1 Tax=Oceanibaculum pacificum TaxID=580166 RepID=A0A154W319_9PROT|nr:DUF4198 domain-containing protein [Oceanibaculum pacificum]KZD07847.1 hypothetical protein AUP43_09500 [Oceanibaculum pacificum]